MAAWKVSHVAPPMLLVFSKKGTPLNTAMLVGSSSQHGYSCLQTESQGPPGQELRPIFIGQIPVSMLVLYLPVLPTHPGEEVWLVPSPHGSQPLGTGRPGTAAGNYFIENCSLEMLWMHSFQAKETTLLQTGLWIVNNVTCLYSKRWHSVNRMAKFIRYPIIKKQGERQTT